MSQDPADRAIVGISSGAVAAFVAAWHRPDAFSRVVSHCGSFTNIKGAHNLPWVVRNTAPRKDIKVFLQTGRYDLDNVHGSWPLANREMAAALTFAGYHNKFVFGEGSHSWKHGGAIFPDTLRWLCLLHIIYIMHNCIIIYKPLHLAAHYLFGGAGMRTALAVARQQRGKARTRQR